MAPKKGKNGDSEIGNTGLSESTSVKKEVQGKYHCFTLSVEKCGLNNGQLCEMLLCLDDIDKYIFQKEKGESGYLHYQGAIWFKKKKKSTWIKKRIHDSIHLELMNNELATIAYCQKTERIEGPFKYNIVEPYMGEDLPSEENLYSWQKEIIKVIKEPATHRKIYWIWSIKGNMGKSTFCKYLIYHYRACEVGGKKSDIAFAVSKNSSIFCFDLSRTVEDYVSYDAMESLKNGKIFSPKYESNMKVFPIPHVFAFANFKPNMEAMSIDRWVIINVDR